MDLSFAGVPSASGIPKSHRGCSGKAPNPGGCVILTRGNLHRGPRPSPAPQAGPRTGRLWLRCWWRRSHTQPCFLFVIIIINISPGAVHSRGSFLPSGLFPKEHSSVRKTTLFLCVSSTVTLPSHDPSDTRCGVPPTTSSAVTPAGAPPCHSTPTVSPQARARSQRLPPLQAPVPSGPQVIHSFCLTGLPAGGSHDPLPLDSVVC